MTTVEFGAAVDRITEQVLSARVETDGVTGWFGYDLSDHDAPDGRTIVRSEPGIYSGRLGVALYLAALDAVGHDWRDSTTGADSVGDLLSFDHVPPGNLVSNLDLGIGSGIGSVVYGLSVLSDLTGQQRYCDRARAVATAVPERRLAEAEEFDVLLGLAGTIHGLLRLYEQTGDHAVLNRAVVCGERLLAARSPKWGFEVWDTHPGDVSSFSTGMGHGAAGVCHALYRLADHAERTSHTDLDATTLREAADDALAFEEPFYSSVKRNWRANWSNIDEFPRWWCYGLPGIGLARIGSLDHHEADHLYRDLDRVSGFEPELGERDSLCHGTFSQVELLVELSRRYDSNHRQMARNLAAEAVRRRDDEGAYRVACDAVAEVTNPSLFLGVAGIGYTLLRLSHPERLPSLLRFE